MFTQAVKLPPSDYKRPFQDVCLEWARWMIDQEKTLDILFSCQKTRPDKGLPSWAPSWIARSDDEYVPNFSQAMLIFRASEDSLPPVIAINLLLQPVLNQLRCKFSSDGREIFVEGRLLVDLDSSFACKKIDGDYEKRFYKFLPPKYIEGQYESIWEAFLPETRLLQGLLMVNFWTVPTLLKKIPEDSALRKQRTLSRLEKLREVITKIEIGSPARKDGMCWSRREPCIGTLSACCRMCIHHLCFGRLEVSLRLSGRAMSRVL
jgi:hypothetical protein